MLAFLLIVGVSYYLVATSLIGLVGDSLFSDRMPISWRRSWGRCTPNGIWKRPSSCWNPPGANWADG